MDTSKFRRAAFVPLLLIPVMLSGCLCPGWEPDTELPPSLQLQNDNTNIPSVADDLAPSDSRMPNSGPHTFKIQFFRENGTPWYREDFNLNINWAELGPTEAVVTMQQEGSNQKSIGRIFRTEETNAPRPADRVFFTYNFFAEQAPGANYRETFSGPIIMLNKDSWSVKGPYTHNNETGTFEGIIGRRISF